MSSLENLPFLPAVQPPVDFAAVSCSKEIHFLRIRVSFVKPAVNNNICLESLLPLYI